MSTLSDLAIESANQVDTSRRASSSFIDASRYNSYASKRHSTPSELPPREKKRRSWLLNYTMERPGRRRSMFHEHESPLDTNGHTEHDLEDIPLEDNIIRPHERNTDAVPYPTRRAIRDSFQRFSNRISLTPSDIPYPTPLFHRENSLEDPEDAYLARTILGIRPLTPPPVPPKDDPIKPSGTSTASSLPSHNKGLPERPLPPLNGRTAWFHALAAVLVVGNCWGISNAFGLFEAYYTRNYLPGTSPSTVAWIGSTQLALVFGLGVPVGRLVDLGLFRAMFHGGTVLMILGLLTSSVCTAFWSLWLTQGLVTGLGMGMVFCSGVLALMSWFDERKMGVAMGLGAAGSCIGGIVYVLIARHFLVTSGFATTMQILGGVAAVSMVPPNLIFRMRHQRDLTRRHAKNKARTPLSIKTFTSPAYIFAALGMFLTFLGVYFGFVYVVSFGSTVLKLSDTASTNLLIFMLVANLPGRFLPALISDKCIGPLNTIIPAAFLSSAVIWLWTASSTRPSQASLTVVACFYGFVSAGVQVLYAPTVYTFCLEENPSTEGGSPELATDKMGVKAGGIFSCIGLACLIGTPIGGALISHRVDRGMDQPYLWAQVFAGACLLVGGGFLLMSRVAKIGWAAKRA